MYMAIHTRTSGGRMADTWRTLHGINMLSLISSVIFVSLSCNNALVQSNKAVIMFIYVDP